MMFVTTTASALLFKQTFISKTPCLKHFYHGSAGSSLLPGDIKRYKPLTYENEDLTARVTRFCKPNYKIICRTPSFVNTSIVPVRFHPEPSMHYPACPDFSKTRLHSLPQTKSPEHPGTPVSPWSPFLGCFRWYAGTNRVSRGSVVSAAGRIARRNPKKEFYLRKVTNFSLSELRKIVRDKALIKGKYSRYKK